jgi:putative SOS response-associated peptidase YedK
MCNRYIARWIDLRRLALDIQLPTFEEFTEKPGFEPSKRRSSGGGTSSAKHVLDFYAGRNEVRPTDRDLVVRVVGDEMRLDLLKWGLVPPFEPQPRTNYATFNAKAETIATIRAYRNAWQKRQRCLIPVEAFFEWKGTKYPKQKYRISVKGESQFCLAGLWEKWERDGKVLETFTIITTTANELIAEIHDKKRMPVIIKPDDYDRWLHDQGDVTDLLKPYLSDAMEAFLVDHEGKSSDEQPDLFSFED